MKKVVSVHLDDKMFQIEEDAYGYLNGVLSAQRENRALEAQVAELLEQKLAGGRTVVIFPDVADALYRLGIPAPELRADNSLHGKRLFRQPKNRLIAGVCTGLAEYLEIDPVAVRVLFVIAFFLGSMGLWLYIVLWIIFPRTTPEPLSARQ